MIQELAEYIFEHVFKYYTMKQWGYTAEEIDPAVTGRVPVSISYDDRYFQDRFQKMPKGGFTKLFENMLEHENIMVQLETEAMNHIHINTDTGLVQYKGARFTKPIIYTGLVDQLLDYVNGDLPYRSLEFNVRTEYGEVQPVTTVNYPTPANEHLYTRITEYKHMMENPPKERSTVAVELPYAYDRNAAKGNVPYYPVFTDESKKSYQAYVDLLKDIPNVYLLGRLAEYKYYNMDAIVEAAINFSYQFLEKK
jgi:UDP-galactopyranose mutase